MDRGSAHDLGKGVRAAASTMRKARPRMAARPPAVEVAELRAAPAAATTESGEVGPAGTDGLAGLPRLPNDHAGWYAFAWRAASRASSVVVPCGPTNVDDTAAAVPRVCARPGTAAVVAVVTGSPSATAGTTAELGEVAESPGR